MSVQEDRVSFKFFVYSFFLFSLHSKRAYSNQKLMGFMQCLMDTPDMKQLNSVSRI